MISHYMYTLFHRDAYISSIAPNSTTDLLALQQRMTGYYLSSPYPKENRDLTANWQDDVHTALCKYIPSESRVLEIGCGDGRSAEEIKRRVRSVSYVGCDLSYKEWNNPEDLVVASADKLAFPDSELDVVLSLYVIEHLVFPVRFLDECWRVLRPGGRLLLIAPDFTYNGMASERIGLSYGSGLPKLHRFHIFDALLTAYDSRIRIPRLRQRRQKFLNHGRYEFPILTKPRCLYMPGFTPGCDAIYPSCPNEIISYMGSKIEGGEILTFYSSSSTFGLMIKKRS